MRTKTKKLTKALLLTSVFAGALCCWSAKAAEAQETFDEHCAACHGKDGKGQTKMGRLLGVKDCTDSKVQESFTDAQATKSIKEGVKESGRQKMPAFGDQLSDDQIKALVKYIRDFKKSK